MSHLYTIRVLDGRDVFTFVLIATTIIGDNGEHRRIKRNDGDKKRTTTIANFSLAEVFPLECTKRRYPKNAVLVNETFIISVDSERRRA